MNFSFYHITPENSLGFRKEESNKIKILFRKSCAKFNQILNFFETCGTILNFDSAKLNLMTTDIATRLPSQNLWILLSNLGPILPSRYRNQIEILDSEILLWILRFILGFSIVMDFCSKFNQILKIFWYCFPLACEAPACSKKKIESSIRFLLHAFLSLLRPPNWVYFRRYKVFTKHFCLLFISHYR